jgi:peptidoglycan/LPS O-acetylase OafA/YrhL
MSLARKLANRDNNFDVLRLAAATMVLVGHAYFLAGDPELKLPFNHELLGDVGVLIFFAISGLLVTRSWLNEPRTVAFVVKRALRLMPALVVSLALTAYVLGPLVTSLPKTEYLSSTAPAKYVIGQSLMLTDHTIQGRFAHPSESLPGVFQSNPFPFFNGSLWSLSVEITAYGLVLLAGLLFLVAATRGSRALAGLVFVGAAATAFWVCGDWAYEPFAAFAGGALLYLLRDRLRLNVWLFVGALAAWYVSYRLPLLLEAFVIGLTLPYAVTYLGFRGLQGLRFLTRPGDVSYGLYIYAWPVSQLVIHVTGTRNPGVVIALGGAITYALAFASWRIIERPALAFKSRLAKTSVSRTPEGRHSPGPLAHASSARQAS